MIKAGIIGGSGYTAGELLRLLQNHPCAIVDFAYSTTHAGKPVSHIHQDLLGDTNLVFTNTINPEVNVVFLCLGHGQSKAFLDSHPFASHTRIIDLGNDFRLEKTACFNEIPFVYGLPEWQKAEIKKAKYIANPGCFATAIQLALLPLAKQHWLQDSIHINATTGSTGAGVQPSGTSHHGWRNNNMSHYKAFEHQHLDEINQSLKQAQNGFDQELLFIPNRGDFTRGIFATLYTKTEASLETIVEQFTRFYADAPFVVVTTEDIHLKQVVQTNKCIISLAKKGGYLLLTSVIDNLIKGASGQAIQNMNLMFGLDEKTGLQLKSGAF
ncbi:N-acetyl-gamma-glutamyl-phosphate reductase [Flavobacterium humi]|uniref:N-acetyl-gamma-glutamyl-phosphate reductase n=1 Tax=Flavobacterium humi TaxID=2562683 RepID=A0A4Z0L7H6_9FLAO|nr:N-acetyl-gamma-glutamyl-phosphate reductase [Flavobacterium humi]TGD58233.1 N-acetyl-gamma-glutamyl-phosphate reductase [Flavobacterium humi]